MRTISRASALAFAVVGWLLAAAMVACPGKVAQRSTLPGCGKDTDCHASRVCDDGECRDRVAGGGASAGQGGAAPAEARPGAPPFAMYKGNAQHTGALAGRPPERAPRPLWQFKTGGPVTGSPTIGPDGTVYVGSHDGSLYAVSAEGALKWSFKTGDRIWSTPAVTQDGTVYTGSDDDHLYAVDTATGRERWRFRVGDCKAPTGFGPEGTRCDADGGPTLGPDGTIYFGGDGVYAVWPDGSLRWKLATTEHVSAAPALAPDGTVYAACQDDVLYAIRPDGTRAWAVRTEQDLESAPAVGPDGAIYFGGDDGALHAVGPDGASRWKVLTGADVRSSPSISGDGTVYVGSHDKNLYAISSSGSVKWRFAAADKIHAAPAVARSGVVLIGSQDDNLYALSPAGVLLWYLELDGDVDAAPSLSEGGVLYAAGDDGVLRAYK